MPTMQQIQAAQKFAETGICECGNYITDHAVSEDDLKTTKIKCCLTQREVPVWNNIPPPRPQG